MVTGVDLSLLALFFVIHNKWNIAENEMELPLLSVVGSRGVRLSRYIRLSRYRKTYRDKDDKFIYLDNSKCP